jgi:hypothetical protein
MWNRRRKGGLTSCCFFLCSARFGCLSRERSLRRSGTYHRGIGKYLDLGSALVAFCLAAPITKRAAGGDDAGVFLYLRPVDFARATNGRRFRVLHLEPLVRTARTVP